MDNQEKANYTNFIEFVYTSESSSLSNIGMINGKPQKISVSKKGAYVGSVIHEIGHAIGLTHEHTRPDRGDYIIIIWPNVNYYKKQYFYKDKLSEPIGVYDYQSIMHYPSMNDFALFKKMPTLVKKDGFAIIPYADQLSPGDISSVSILYPPIESLGTTFTDSRDGKTYKTVKIGDQTWMAENLAFDAGNNCWKYENDEKNIATYGRLYSLSVAKNACPSGWHLPSDNEWEQLAIYISETKGPYSKAGDGDDWKELGKHLKTATGWNESGNGTNDFGFSALPGGHRINDGVYEDIGYNGYWWSSDEKIRSLSFYFSYFISGLENADAGLSIRCIKGEQQESEIRIGNFYQGGIIFYIDNTGQHGLVVAQTDQSTGIKWYNGIFKITGATGTAIGTGKSNTSAIVTALGTGDYAANLCSQLTLNGYNDWFLPSKEELNLLFLLNTDGKLNDYAYWSSTESGGGFGGGAWYRSKSFSANGNENFTARVRAIRAF